MHTWLNGLRHSTAVILLTVTTWLVQADIVLDSRQPYFSGTHHLNSAPLNTTKDRLMNDPWQYRYRHLTAPQWPYANEHAHVLLVTLPNLCFDRVARVLRTPAVHALLSSVASTPILSRKLYESRHTSLRVRVKPMLQNQGMMFVLEHRSFSAQRSTIKPNF